MAIQQENFSRVHLCQRAAQFDDKRDVRHLRHAQGAGEKEMMRRMPGPKRGQAEDFSGTGLLETVSDRRDNVGVRGKRQMRAVLLERAQRQHHENLRQLQLFDFRPGKVFQPHTG